MVFDTYETLKIAGKEYKLRYPVEMVAGLERELRSGNLLLTIANFSNPDIAMSLGDYYALFKYALLGGGDATPEETSDLFLAAKDTYDDAEIIKALASALQKSGLLREKKGKAAKKA